jgi:hypothetical protein
VLLLNTSVALGSPKVSSGKQDGNPPGMGFVIGDDQTSDDVLPVPPDLQTDPDGPAAPTVPTTPTTNPQVVTTPTLPGPAVVTTTPQPTPLPPPPLCLNHPDFTLIPNGWYKDSAGNCYVQAEDNFGLCQIDQFYLTAASKVDALLKSGYSLSIYVDGAGPDYKLNCMITDLVTYGLNPKDFVFSGKYVQDGGPSDGTFDTPTPSVGMGPLYPYWVPKTATAALTQHQTVQGLQAYGLLWGGKWYGTVASFTRQLKSEGGTWRGWKKNHLALAAGLLAHVQLLRRL